MFDITLFGSTAVDAGDRHWGAAELCGTKPRQILELLALSLGTPVPKEVLAESLWEGQPPASYLATLESYVCVLRRTLSLGCGRGAALATMNKCYVLDDAQVSVDVVDVRRALETASPQEVARIVERLDGELLATEPYVGWANDARWAFHEQLAHTCTAAAAAAGAARDDELAVRLARTAVLQPYFSERARQELIKALFRGGERAQALNVYAEMRRQMVEELGIEPGPESQQLYRAILKGGSHGTESSHTRFEVVALLRLLRQAFESGVEIDGPDEPGLVELSRLLLSPLFAGDQPMSGARVG
jgi:DNA-binding SARP family transcriptional activator